MPQTGLDLDVRMQQISVPADPVTHPNACELGSDGFMAIVEHWGGDCSHVVHWVFGNKTVRDISCVMNWPNGISRELWSLFPTTCAELSKKRDASRGFGRMFDVEA